MSCDCCELPGDIEGPLMRVREYAADLGKCGFEELNDPSTPPKYYLEMKQEITWSGSWTNTWTRTSAYETPPPPDRTIVSTYGFELSGYCLKIDEYDPATCEVDYGDWTAPLPEQPYLTEIFHKTKSCTGGGDGNACSADCEYEDITYTACDESEEPPNDTSGDVNCDDNGTVLLDLPEPGEGEGLISLSEDSPPDKTYFKHTEWEGCLTGCTQTDPLGPFFGSSQNYGTLVTSGDGTLKETETTLSNEYTTSELIANAIAALSETSDSVEADATAIRDLAGDESAFSLQRAVINIRHAPTPTGYLKVWLRESIDGGAPTEFDTYVWTQPAGVSDPLSEIEGADIAVDELESNGTRVVTIWKWSLLPDYNPSAGQTNGFPDWPEGGVVPE